MSEPFTITRMNFDSAITGAVIPPDRYNLYINGAGPIAWTMQGMSDLTVGVKVNGGTAQIIVDNNVVTDLIVNPTIK